MRECQYYTFSRGKIRYEDVIVDAVVNCWKVQQRVEVKVKANLKVASVIDVVVKPSQLRQSHWQLSCKRGRRRRIGRKKKRR